MSRLSFRPCPLDIYKKLPIVKSGKDLDGDDIASVSKNLPSSSNGVAADNELVCQFIEIYDIFPLSFLHTTHSL
jgi:hypothetical protein